MIRHFGVENDIWKVCYYISIEQQNQCVVLGNSV